MISTGFFKGHNRIGLLALTVVSIIAALVSPLSMLAAAPGDYTVSTVGSIGNQFTPKYNPGDGNFWTMTTAGFDAIGKITPQGVFTLVDPFVGGGGGSSPEMMQMLHGLGSKGVLYVADANYGGNWWKYDATNGLQIAIGSPWPIPDTTGNVLGMATDGTGTRLYHHIYDKIKELNAVTGVVRDAVTNPAFAASSNALTFLEHDGFTDTLIGLGTNAQGKSVLYRINVNTGVTTNISLPAGLPNLGVVIPDAATGLLYAFPATNPSSTIFQIDPVAGTYEQVDLGAGKFLQFSTFAPARSGPGKSLYGIAGTYPNYNVVEIGGPYPFGRPAPPSNQPPGILIDNTNVVVNEGSRAENGGSYSDPNSGDDVDITASIGTIQKSGKDSGNWSWKFDTTDGPVQTQTVLITANDGKGGIRQIPFNLSVSNVSPAVNIVGPSGHPEGMQINLTGNVSDVSPVDQSAGFSNYNWTITRNGNPWGPIGNAPDFSFLPNDNGLYIVTLRVTDKDFGTGAGSKTINVVNVAPVVTPQSPQTTYEGAATIFSLGSFTDPGADSPWTVTINWGDGSANTFFNQGAPGPIGPALQSHTYVYKGTYPVTVTVTDKDNAFGSAIFQVTVLIPSPPRFSLSYQLPPYASPDVKICTPLVMNTNVTGAEHWFARADGSGTMTISLIAHSVNSTDAETVVARIYDSAGIQIPPDLIASYPAGTPAGTERVSTITINTTLGAIYTINISTPNTPGTQPHYRLTFVHAREVAINSPSWASLEPQAPVLWFLNVNAPEDPAIRIFSQGVPMPLNPVTETAQVLLIDPLSNTVLSQSLSALMPPGIDSTLTAAGAGTGIWRLRINEINEHYRLEKTSGTDNGLYLTPASFGHGSISGTIKDSGGAAYTGSVDVKVFRLSPSGPQEQVASVTTNSGSFNISNIFVGPHRVRIVPPPDVMVLAPSFFDVFVSCESEERVNFRVNRPPKADAGPDQTVNEGSTVTLNGGASSDPDGNPLTYNWMQVGGPPVALSSNTAVNPTFFAPDDAVLTFKLTVNDGFGGSNSDEVVITVRNIAPVIASLTATQLVVLGNATTVNGTFTDVGTQDTHTVSISWGDLSTTSAAVTEAGGSGSFVGSHVYSTAQIYTVTVTVKDDDGGTATGTIQVTVTAIGKMTGGGRVDTGLFSPAKGNAKPQAIHTTHGFELWVNADLSVGGNLQYNDHRNGDIFHVTNFTSIIFINDTLLNPGNPNAKFDTAIVSGVGRLNGVDGVKFEAVITDNGEPGKTDTFKITFPDVQSPGISGRLVVGNHQAHPPQ